MENPFPQIIKTRIAGRKVTKFTRNGFVMLRVVREEYPSVIWVSWIRKIGERTACVESEKGRVGA
ncbi:MAG TPA: hypothetical protein VMW42_02915 [Desulfatiglandales bacterium]|nr:hypothetical protein [Desulfatiglandales bacterium]